MEQDKKEYEENRRAAYERQQQMVKRVSARDPEITRCQEVYESEGTRLTIDVYLPNKEKYPGIRPGILFFFGGGFRGGTPLAFREHAEACARQGYVAMAADYRVSALYENVTSKEGMTDGANAWNYVRENAARWDLDPARIVLSGGSAGGLIAAMCGRISGVNPAGLALFNPGFLDENNGPAALADILGTEVRGIPVVNAKDILPDTPPTLIMHGEEDQIISIETIRRYVENAKAAGVDVRLVSYPGMTHGFFNYNRDRAHYYLTMGELLMFLQRICGGDK